MSCLGYIRILKRSGEDGSHYPVYSNCRIGNSEECDVRVHLPGVAPVHCIITSEDNGQCCVQNKSHENPTLLNGTALNTESKKLAHYDKLTLLERTFRWEYLEGSPFYILWEGVHTAHPNSEKMPDRMETVPSLSPKSSTIMQLHDKGSGSKIRSAALRRASYKHPVSTKSPNCLIVVSPQRRREGRNRKTALLPHNDALRKSLPLPSRCRSKIMPEMSVGADCNISNIEKPALHEEAHASEKMKISVRQSKSLSSRSVLDSRDNIWNVHSDIANVSDVLVHTSPESPVKLSETEPKTNFSQKSTSKSVGVSRKSRGRKSIKASPGGLISEDSFNLPVINQEQKLPVSPSSVSAKFAVSSKCRVSKLRSPKVIVKRKFEADITDERAAKRLKVSTTPKTPGKTKKVLHSDAVKSFHIRSFFTKKKVVPLGFGKLDSTSKKRTTPCEFSTVIPASFDFNSTSNAKASETVVEKRRSSTRRSVRKSTLNINRDVKNDGSLSNSNEEMNCTSMHLSSGRVSNATPILKKKADSCLSRKSVHFMSDEMHVETRKGVKSVPNSNASYTASLDKVVTMKSIRLPLNNPIVLLEKLDIEDQVKSPAQELFPSSSPHNVAHDNGIAVQEIANNSLPNSTELCANFGTLTDTNLVSPEVVLEKGSILSRNSSKLQRRSGVKKRRMSVKSSDLGERNTDGHRKSSSRLSTKVTVDNSPCEKKHIDVTTNSAFTDSCSGVNKSVILLQSQQLKKIKPGRIFSKSLGASSTSKIKSTKGVRRSIKSSVSKTDTSYVSPEFPIMRSWRASKLHSDHLSHCVSTPASNLKKSTPVSDCNSDILNTSDMSTILGTSEKMGMNCCPTTPINDKRYSVKHKLRTPNKTHESLVPSTDINDSLSLAFVSDIEPEDNDDDNFNQRLDESSQTTETNITDFDFSSVKTPQVTREMFVSPLSSRKSITSEKSTPSHRVTKNFIRKSLTFGKRRSKCSKSDVEETESLKTPEPDYPPSNASSFSGVKKLANFIKIQASPKNDLTDVQGVKKVWTPPKIQASPKNDLTDVQGVKKLMRTPKIQASPKNDLTNVQSLKKLMRTPKIQASPKNDLTNVRGVKKLMRTPKIQASPKNDLTDVRGVKKLMRTPKIQASPKNDLTDVRGVKKLMRTPKIQASPKNDLTDVRGVKKLMRTPKIQTSPQNDLTDVRGVRKLMRTPKIQTSPQNDLTDVRGVKKLLKTPKIQASPKNDLTDVRGVKKLMRTPKIQASPKNDLTDVRGVKKLMRTPKIQASPKNDLTDVRGVKKLMRTPKIQASPKNDLTDVRGVKKLMRTPKIQASPKNDLTDVRGVKKLMRTPKIQASPKNDLTDVRGVKKLMRTLKIQASPKNDLTDVQGVKKLMRTPEIQPSPKNDLTDVIKLMESGDHPAPKNLIAVGEVHVIKSSNHIEAMDNGGQSMELPILEKEILKEVNGVPETRKCFKNISLIHASESVQDSCEIITAREVSSSLNVNVESSPCKTRRKVASKYMKIGIDDPQQVSGQLPGRLSENADSEETSDSSKQKRLTRNQMRNVQIAEGNIGAQVALRRTGRRHATCTKRDVSDERKGVDSNTMVVQEHAPGTLVQEDDDKENMTDVENAGTHNTKGRMRRGKKVNILVNDLEGSVTQATKQQYASKELENVAFVKEGTEDFNPVKSLRKRTRSNFTVKEITSGVNASPAPSSKRGRKLPEEEEKDTSNIDVPSKKKCLRVASKLQSKCNEEETVNDTSANSVESTTVIHNSLPPLRSSRRKKCVEPSTNIADASENIQHAREIQSQSLELELDHPRLRKLASKERINPTHSNETKNDIQSNIDKQSVSASRTFKKKDRKKQASECNDNSDETEQAVIDADTSVPIRSMRPRVKASPTTKSSVVNSGKKKTTAKSKTLSPVIVRKTRSQKRLA